MTITLLLAAFLSIQQPSLYQRVIERPDPNNGYDDYVRAADVIRGFEFDLCANWTPRQYDDLLAAKASNDPSRQWTDRDEARLSLAHTLNGLDYLGVQRYAANRWASALALVRLGNRKKVWDPRSDIDLQTVYPELPTFRMIAKLFRADSFVRFADGDSKAGTTDLLEALTFSRRIGGDNVLSELVAGSCEATALAAFEDHLSQLSEKDAAEIAKDMDAALAEPPTFQQALQGDRHQIMSSIDFVLAQPEVLISNPPKPTAEEAAAINAVKGLNANDRQIAKADIARKTTSAYERLIAQAGKSESSWADSSANPSGPSIILTAEDAADAVCALLLPNPDRVVAGIMRVRAQLRLLDLHARIIQFKWHTNQLPEELRQVAPPQLTYDPMAKEQFHYELNDHGYRLFAKGLPITGPIELQYRRPANLNGGKDLIPPLSPEGRKD
jgi:hypothetical protein